MSECCRAAVRVTGTVQGVGFRPFVYRTAVDAGVAGYVRNTGDSVEATFEGSQAAIEQVLQTVRTDPPPLATVQAVDVEWRDPTGVDGFEIRDSTGEHAGGVDAPVPPDTGICEACLDDLRDPDSRYHEYWATACVDCGPRFAVVEDVPYDRARTSMAAFPLCDGCRERYETPTSRRYHAQTIGCPDCGPTLRYERDDECVATGPDAIARAGDALTDGAILAVKGTGGIHLVCDATDPETVELLRDRTGRSAKPFACMARSVDTIETFAEVDSTARGLLTDIRSPIMLLETTTDASWLDAVAPGLSTFGVMTPYAGLHHLLFDHVEGPLVMTSANRPGQPMCTTTAAVWDRLGDVVDGVVAHDREIVARCDDSVVRVVDDTPRFVRRSRGWTPTTLPNPVGVDGESPVVLAVGPERDATVAVAGGGSVVTSQHIGAVDSPDTLAFHRESVTHLLELPNVTPDVVACDQHPDFLTTTEAKQYAADGMVGPVAVQHHHAHAAALCAEHGVSRAIVVTADGTGYGPDGTIWGGEVLDVTYDGFERVGGLSSFVLPGGEAAIEYPARILAGLLTDADRIDDRLLETGAVERQADAAVVRQQAERGVNAPTTTSVGRYLDAVSALVGACDRRTYEGEPAQRLEALARNGAPQPIEVPYETRNGCRVLDVQTLVRSLAALTDDASAADVAATAQHAVASGLATIALDTAADRNVSAIGFTGGVAYNDAISRQLRTHIDTSDCRYLEPEMVPPGDAGIAYGQAIVATARNVSVAANR